MNKIQFVARSSALNRKFLNSTSCLKILHANKTTGSDDEKDLKTDTKKRKGDATSKLNDLLKKMVKDDVVSNETKIKLARPSNKRELFSQKRNEAVKKVPVEKQIVNVVKDVAETLGGDAKLTESELLSKLLGPISDKPQSPSNLSDIVKGMKIDRESKPDDRQSRAEQVKKLLQSYKSTNQNIPQNKQRAPRRMNVQRKGPEQITEKIDLFGSEPLGIFTNKATFKDGVENKTWKELHDRELKLAVTHPPSNYFQQMILWTEQGKIWKFPIDNEQGLENDVYFAEHIFLEKHLESWCPTKGPIRHFMELVCVGLSKNPYITVEDKKEHIEWFRNYFEDKKKLLREVGALPTESKPQPKGIE